MIFTFLRTILKVVIERVAMFYTNCMHFTWSFVKKNHWERNYLEYLIVAVNNFFWVAVNTGRSLLSYKIDFMAELSLIHTPMSKTHPCYCQSLNEQCYENFCWWSLKLAGYHLLDGWWFFQLYIKIFLLVCSVFIIQ